MDKHNQNISDIKLFLDDNSIDYKQEENRFIIWHNSSERRSYDIHYVPSCDYPISYPKFGISGVDKDYFFKLSLESEENNSFKLWIKDFEWEDFNKKEVLKSYILHAADKTPNTFYARDCEIREVSSKEAREFETINCFYGKRGASLNLGLYLKKDKLGYKSGTLLMIYTFGKNFFGKKEGIIEIIRVGTLRFCNVVGGSSKLLNHFLKNYKNIKIGDKMVKVEEIKFYSDYDHNLGGSMDKLGFEFIGYSKGGFMNYWIETNKIKNREPMRHKWVMEQMQLGKCLAIPNSGVKNYLLKLS